MGHLRGQIEQVADAGTPNLASRVELVDDLPQNEDRFREPALLGCVFGSIHRLGDA